MPIRKPSKQAKKAGKAINTRRVAEIRYDSSSGKERNWDYVELADEFHNEIMAAISKARIPLDAAKLAIEMCQEDITDRLISESLSWSESMTPWQSGGRNRSE